MVARMTAVKQTLAEQEIWARDHERDSRRKDYLKRIADNLFMGRLEPETESELQKGDGAELIDTHIRPAKMRALVSSSVLAVNFFDAWRSAPKHPLNDALGLRSEITEIRFEFRPVNYPVRPRSPNLDLLLHFANGGGIAIESKFTEPYRAKTHPNLSDKYFPRSRCLWEEARLPAAQKIAGTLSKQWRHLDVAQLLKHMLGLASDPTAPKNLLYIWFDTASPDADTHREEIHQFERLVQGDCVKCQSLTYQEVFGKLSPSTEPKIGWYTYMRDRYFRGPTPNL